MSELKPCPFCGEKARTIPLIGNNTSFGVECSNEDCPANHINQTWYTLSDAVSAWNRRYQEPNEPLTLEQLRKMDGEPVWIVAYPDWGHWELSEDAEDYFEDRDEDFYGMKMRNDPEGRYGLHALGWLAYGRKPESEEA
jgi:hypothetical protein